MTDDDWREELSQVFDPPTLEGTSDDDGPPPLGQDAGVDEVAARLLDDYFDVFEEISHIFAADVRNLALLESLGDRIDEFFQRAHSRRLHFSDWEWDDLEQSVTEMRLFLRRGYDEAIAEQHEPAPAITWLEHPGGRGRPSLRINYEFLSAAVHFYGPRKIARFVGCDKLTVVKEITRYGLVHTWDHRLRVSDTEQVQTLILEALAINPLYGSRMIQTAIKAATSLNVARQTILDNMPNKRKRRRNKIARRKYKVPGPNSIWHHDGQHGLIHWGIVIHAFVDGFSRFITGIRASGNNRAETVKQLFLDACGRYLVPLRVRGDHGVENLQVAAWMNIFRGYQRGSYIWGSSVHNTRIERLWREVTYYVGDKWKQCFQRMEREFYLNRHNRNHIWLLHQLFLNTITKDLLQFANEWNEHIIRMSGQRHQSPAELFNVGQWVHGFRGDPLPPDPNNPTPIGTRHDDEMNLTEVTAFGVAWEDLDRAQTQEAVRRLDEQTWTGRDAPPPNLAQVLVTEPDGVLSGEEMDFVWEHTSQFYGSLDKDDIVNMWIEAIAAAHRVRPDLF